MTKLELLMKISGETGLTKDQIDSVLKAYQAITIAEMKEQGEVNVLEIGKIKISRRPERKGVNFMTKEPMVIPAANVAKFSFSKKLKEAASESKLPAAKK
ncbi:HU family DNA-binding protein [Mycoplasma suis]|nr:HU family DNA-binding protein [Mycoplasma suis]